LYQVASLASIEDPYYSYEDNYTMTTALKGIGSVVLKITK